MGLDMCLYKVKNADKIIELEERLDRLDEEEHKIEKEIKKLYSDWDDEWCIPIELIYWRKANAIYGFFIRLNEKAKNCEPIKVTKSDLVKLHNVCDEVVKAYKHGDIEKCEELLPTVSGFFFGPTEYDDYYIEQVKRTKEELERKILNSKHNEYIFEASW